jgi:SGNH hydrolase-like domain, acetyltransferase AlgX
MSSCMQKAKTPKKLRLIFLEVVAVSIVSLFAAEIALRIYNRFNPSFVFYSNSYDRFRGKPFADDWNFKLNSLGFKDKEFSAKKVAVYRILGIGDSFSFGVVPYENNYLTLVESQLQKEHPKLEVFNMGIPNTGPKEYLSLLVAEGLAFKPEMVLLSFFVGNDFSESKRREWYEYSYVASLLHYIFTLRPSYEGTSPHGSGNYCDDCPTFSHDRYLEIEASRSSIYLKGNRRFSTSLDRAMFYLSQIQTICKQQSIDFIVVIIPDELQVNQDLQREVRDKFYPNIDAQKWDITFPNRSLADRLDKLGINNLDLYEHFAQNASSRRLYRPRDSHWNIEGNRLAADLITRHIQDYLREQTRTWRQTKRQFDLAP